MTTSEISGLEKLERKVYESTWEDGLIDLCSGVALLLMGMFWVTGQSAYGTFAAPLMISIWVAARKRISEPRIGAVVFGPKRVTKLKSLYLGLFGIGVLTLFGGIFLYIFVAKGNSTGVLPQMNFVAGLPAILLAIPALVVALTLRLARFIVYAALLMLSGVLVVVMDLHPGWAFLPSGALCACVGAGMLVAFVRKNPLPG